MRRRVERQQFRFYRTTDRQTQYPKRKNILVERLSTLQTKQIIQNIILLKSKQDVSDLLNSIKLQQKLIKQSLPTIFLNLFSKKIEECFEYIQSQEKNFSDQIKIQFLQSIYLIFRKTPIKISFKLFFRIWEIIQKTSQFEIFHKYSSVLTSIVLYSSMKQFDKASNNVMKKILGKLVAQFKFITGNSKQQINHNQVGLAIFIDYEKLSEEQKLVIKFHLFRLIEMIQKQEKTIKSQDIEKFQDEVLNLAKKKDCKTLYGVLNKFPNLCRKLYSKISNQFINYSINIQQKCLVGKQQILSKESMNIQNISLFLNQEDDLTKEINITIHQNKIYSKFNMKLLENIEKNIVRKQENFKIDCIFSLKIILIKLFQNQNLDLYFVQRGIQQKISMQQFIGKVFQIFIKYLYLSGKKTKSQDIQHCFNEDFIELFMDNFLRWSQNQTYRNNQNSLQTLGDVISFSSFYLYRNFQKSKQICSKILTKSLQLILIFNKIPNNWRIIKHLRFLLEVSMTEKQAIDESTKTLTHLFFNTYFSPQFCFIKGSYYVFLDKTKPNQSYCKFFSQLLLKRVQSFESLLKLQKNQNQNYDQNIFIFKVGVLALGQFKFTNTKQVCDIFQRIYLKHAMQLQWIYPLRTWIMFNSPFIQLGSITQKILKISSKIKQNEFLFETENIQKYLQRGQLQTGQTQFKFIELIKQIQLLQNMLDLKQITLQISKQDYKSLIHNIIKPLSNWCGKIYYKISLYVQEQKENIQKIKQIIYNNLFNHKKSIYNCIFEALGKLQTTLRIYLCNIEKTINYKQTQIISIQIGQLINQSLIASQQIFLSHLKLVKNLTGLQKLEYQSHLTLMQVFNNSIAYNSQKYKIQTQMSSMLPLNIVIPLSNTLKANFPLFIALLTSQKRKIKSSQLQQQNRNYEYILQGKNLQILVQNENNELDNFLKNQNATISSTILKNFFLSPLMSKKKLDLQQIGFSLYLTQIKYAFQSQKCQQYIQDHMQQILYIFKHKNSKYSQRSYDYDDDQEQNQPEIFTINQPCQFAVYQIHPLKFQAFKEQIVLILKKFLNKFPTLLFSQNVESLMVSLKSIINFIEQISSLNKQKQQNDSITVDYLLIKLIQKSKQVFEIFFEKQKQSRQANISSKFEKSQKNEKQKQQNSQQLQQGDLRERIRRKMRQREKNKRNKAQSPLYALFNVLASIKKNNQKLIKKCFQMEIQTTLLKFLQIANKKEVYQLKQICQFIQITLPKIYKTQKIEQISAAIEYYRLIFLRIQNIQLKNLNFVVPLLVRLLKQVNNFRQIGSTEFAEQIITRIKVITFKCFQLPFKMSRQNLDLILNQIFKTNNKYLQKQIQFQVRSFIDLKYKMSTIILPPQKSDYSIKKIIQPDHIEIQIQNLREKFENYIENYPTLFYKIIRQIFEGWKQSNFTMVYNKGLQRLTRFTQNGLSFAEYRAPVQIQHIILKIVRQFTKIRILGSQLVIERTQKTKNIQNQKEIQQLNKEFYKKITPLSKNMHNYLEVIQSIMKNNQLLIPFISAIPIKNKKGQEITFLDFVIDVCIEQNIESMINLLTIFLNKNGLYVNYTTNMHFSQYVSAKVLMKIVYNFKNEKQEYKVNQTVYFTIVCLGIKIFNSFSQLNVSDNQADNLKSEIEKLLHNYKNNENTSPVKLLYQECLYLIMRHKQIEKLKTKNSLKQLTQQGQFINQKLFLIANKLTRNERRRFMDDQDDFEYFMYRQRQMEQQKSLTIKVTKRNLQNNISWKSLKHILSAFGQYINIKIYQENQMNIQQKIQREKQISTEVKNKQLSQFYKIQNQAKKKTKNPRRRRRLARYGIGQQNRKVIKTQSINSNRQLYMYYQNLRNILPASKYKVPKKQSKFISISSQDSSQDQIDQTIRIQLENRFQNDEEQNLRDSFYQDRNLNNNISDRQFIVILQSLRPNSLELIESQNLQIKNVKQSQKTEDLASLQIPLILKLSKTNSKKQQNIMVQVTQQQNMKNNLQQTIQQQIKEKQELIQLQKKQKQQIILSQKMIKLLENQNYRKYYNMPYSQKIQFLINQADDKFFENLPPQTVSQIKEQATLLRNQRVRLLAQKRMEQRQSNSNFGMQYRPRRLQKKINKQKIKYQALAEQQQIILSEQIIQNILKCLFIKVITKKQLRRSQGSQLNCGKSISLLLQTKKSNIKYKVLTTLLLILKNLQKISIAYYQKNQQEQWKKSQKPGGLTLKQAKQKFISQTLSLIKHSVDQFFFNNDELVLQNLNANNYYSQILPKNLVGFQKQNQTQNQNTYSPFNQVLALALEHDHQFASLLLKKSGNVNNKLICKIFDLMKDNKISEKSFYQNLKSIENNQILINLFKDNYSLENPPSFELLGKILKYKFGQLEFAKNLHVKALYQYKNTYNQYLTEIFSLYTIPQLQKKQNQLIKFKKIYSNIVQKFYENRQNIRESPLFKITELPQLLDFKTRKSIFRSDPLFDRINPFGSEVELLIDLENVFATSYNQIMRLQPSQILQNIRVKFCKSTSHGSGMFKTLLQLLYVQMFNANTGMFATVELDGIYQPSKLAAYSNPEYLNCFKFLGRILGICLLQNQIFPAFFTSTFYKMLLNKQPNWKDLRQVNKQMFLLIRGLVNSRQQQPDTQIKNLGDPIYFIYKGKDMAFRDIQYPLKQNGQKIELCNDNLEEFIQLMTRSLLIDFCQKQYQKIKEGFNQIVPIDKLSIFTSEDLQKLISGISKFDKKQLKQCCEIHGFKKQDQQIQWFWKYVDQCNDEDLVDLVEYFYGMCKLPAGGFSSIHVSINKLSEVNTYPRATLCGKMGINLPKYTSYQIFVQKFEQAKVLAKKGGGLMEF